MLRRVYKGLMIAGFAAAVAVVGLVSPSMEASKAEAAGANPSYRGGVKVGIYGNAWVQWIRKPENRDFDYIMLQYRMTNAKFDTWVTSLSNRGIPMHIILQLFDNSGTRLKPKDLELRGNQRMLLENFATTVETTQGSGVIGYSIGEENPARNAPFLATAYDLLKTIAPSAKIYQWYTNTRDVRLPGQGIPDLPSDGWIFDDYRRDYGGFAVQLDHFRQRPEAPIAVVWLSPNTTPNGGRGNVAAPGWWNNEGWRAFHDQTVAAVERGADVVFYAFAQNYKGKHVPIWRDDDLCSERFFDHVRRFTIPAIRSGAVGTHAPATRPSWVPGYC